MGAIGVGSRGSGDLRGFMGFGQVQVVAVCDVDRGHRMRMKSQVDGKYGEGCAAYVDFRDLADRDDLDAVMVATPDHWHALTTIACLRSGKDVFCEKPLSLTIRAGRAMTDATRKYGRVFSSGSQRVLGDYGNLARTVRSGAIGKVKEAFVGVGGPSHPCNLPAMPVPDGLDWNMWLGPAPWRPFNRKIHPYTWRAYREYSGGGMTDWGAHKFAAAMFSMELEYTGPVEIIPPDGNEHKRLTFVFANGVRMYHGGGDITIKGTDGQATRRSHPKGRVEMPEYRGRGGLIGDFLHCVKTRQLPFRDVEIAHRAATTCHLGNIAYWLNRRIRWDPEKEEIVGDPVAARWVDRPRRAPWVL
jgi:predicted dehydrogenase